MALRWNTVGEPLRTALQVVMTEPLFEPFRLVGGTSLSLQLGHRMSVDIDLFTDAPYGSVDFKAIVDRLRVLFPKLDMHASDLIGMGCSCFIGNDDESLVKLDVYHSTEPFMRPVQIEDGMRLAHIEDILAMKLEIVGRGPGRNGRKKDFWDLHALLDRYSMAEMLALYAERYPYGHSSKDILDGSQDFRIAEDDFDPICLQGKHWELIKLDIIRASGS